MVFGYDRRFGAIVVVAVLECDEVRAAALRCDLYDHLQRPFGHHFDQPLVLRHLSQYIQMRTRKTQITVRTMETIKIEILRQFMAKMTKLLINKSEQKPRKPFDWSVCGH